MPVRQLTKRVIDSLQPLSQAYFAWDSTVRGLGVKVTPTGSRSFVLQYRVPGMGRRGTARRITLGAYGALTLESARILAKKHLGQVANGGDPASERRARRDAPTLRELGREFIADVEGRCKRTTAAEQRRLWEKHILPALGSRSVRDLSASDVRSVHRSLCNTPYNANRVRALISAAMTFAEREGLRPRGSNPVADVRPYPEEGRERFLTREEIQRLGAALDLAKVEGLPVPPSIRGRARGMSHARRAKLTGRKRGPYRRASLATPQPANPFAVAAIQLLLLTGCREGEILQLRWDEIDFERGFLRLKDTKTRRSVRRVGALPLALLASLPRFADSEFVFPGRKPGAPLREIKRLWYAVKHHAGLEDVRIHDLRHTYGSYSAPFDSPLITRDLLGHADVKTTQRYAHLGDDPVREAANRISDDLGGLLRIHSPTLAGRAEAKEPIEASPLDDTGGAEVAA